MWLFCVPTHVLQMKLNSSYLWQHLQVNPPLAFFLALEPHFPPISRGFMLSIGSNALQAQRCWIEWERTDRQGCLCVCVGRRNNPARMGVYIFARDWKNGWVYFRWRRRCLDMIYIVYNMMLDVYQVAWYWGFELYHTRHTSSASCDVVRRCLGVHDMMLDVYQVAWYWGFELYHMLSHVYAVRVAP